MSSDTYTVCSDCGALINGPASATVEERAPCDICGSKRRTFGVEVKEAPTVREKLGLKHKRPGYKKAIYESVGGDDLHRDTGQWNHLSREIDRESNRYRELITNPATGEVLRSVDEPLTDHVGRGSARKNEAE
jgi:DNA-directed RNA polymerase subunit RPC12/RpoP